MAINLDDRYPGRANPKSVSYPQGSFKDRTAPDAKDGTYLQQDWANDQLAFFQSLMLEADLIANGTVDTVTASQYFDALIATIRGRSLGFATFAEINALTENDGPIICTDMAGDLYTWTNTAFFTGYRNPRSGLWYGGASDTPEAWELPARGGVWLESDPKHRRVIARYREWGRVKAVGDWEAKWNFIADLGGGQWKAPDLRDVFQRMDGTDADTANARGVGGYQKSTEFGASGVFGAYPAGNTMRGLRGGESTGTTQTAPSVTGISSETYTDYRIRPDNAAVAPYILV